MLGRSDGTIVGGHLLDGRVRPTLDVILIELPSFLRKGHDPDSRLALIRISDR